jgi:hypothetical protein
MASVPSIKGSVFAGLTENVAKLLARGDVAQAELSRWLEPEDVALLDEEIVVSAWYDIAAYDRLNRLLLHVEGNGDVEFFRDQGRQTARRLLEGGLYSQLEYLHRAQVTKQSDQQSRFEAFGRDLRLLTSLSASILNFSRWTARPDPSHEFRHIIEITDASQFPESLCWRSDGFVNEMASIHGEPDLWGWERPAQERIVFQMLRAA